MCGDYERIRFNIVTACQFTKLSTLWLDFNFFFFFNDRATPEFSPLPLHDALPIWSPRQPGGRLRPLRARGMAAAAAARGRHAAPADRPAGAGDVRVPQAQGPRTSPAPAGRSGSEEHTS